LQEEKMTTWQEYFLKEGHAPDWPYPVNYEKEREEESDVLIIGGGIAGCWAAISAARMGLKVTLVEKGDVQRSGAGGPGCDHWCNVPLNPLSNVDADEWAGHMADRPFCNGIGIQIQCREDWDTLQEMEQMGGKIRDTKDEYVGAQGRDAKSKFMLSPRYGVVHSYLPAPEKKDRKPLASNPDPENHPNNVVMRIWGSTFKPALKKECKRLGVKVYDRIMGTSLLNENGVPGARVVGATGLNSRTGEFMIFKSKATIISTAGASSIWLMSMELGGYSNMASRNTTGEGTVMAWKAGASLVNMESGGVVRIATGMKHKWYTGAGDASYENVPLVDANGKRLPLPIQGWEDYGAMAPNPGTENEVRAGILSGKWALPFYGDWPAMSDVERRATWNLMLGEESTTKIIIDTFNKAGFDGSRDLQQSYKFLEGNSLPQWREGGGAIQVDWDLKTTLDGLYAAGSSTFCAEDHSYCAATGRYAGRKAAAYANQISAGKVSREQIEKEKARVYAPTKRSSGTEWKEVHAGIARVMQYYVSEFKTENLFKMGLQALQKIEKEELPRLYALDPHKLMRTLEDSSLLSYAQIIIQASMARKASTMAMGFQRIDYPALDPAWNKFSTIKLENGKVKTGLLPLAFWGNMKKEYEARNKDYQGVYKKK
jgi:succinate dehydrogenase/fumarate reductase flavoprotein subunit